MSRLNGLSPEREAELAPLSPYARFEIPSEKKDWEYPEYLESLLSEMLGRADTFNQNSHYHFNQPPGDESGIGFTYIGGRSMTGCKLYWYSGKDRMSRAAGWNKGCLFRDHEDMSTYKVDEIFLVTDAFAAFLIAKKIPFTLFVRRRVGFAEEVRAKFP